MSSTVIASQTMARVWWRIVPLMTAALFFNVLDRINIGFAALRMNEALGLSHATFGLAAGFLAIGIALFGIPSTLILHRVGARRWISSSLVFWSLCSAATAFVRNVDELLAVRFLLGMAEAGFVPGAIHYFSYWFPSEYRGRVLGSFIFIQPVALIVGGPVSGALLTHGGLFGLDGWQWLFVIEALPALMLAPLMFWLLPDKPADARWLSRAEKEWIGEQLAPAMPHTPLKPLSIAHTFTSGRVWMLAVAYLAFATAGTGPTFFMPLIIQSTGFSIWTTGLLTALPPIAGALALPFWGLWADRCHRRELVVAVAAGTLAAGLLGTAVLLPSAWALVPLTIAMIGYFGFTPGFWTLPAAFLSGASAAAGIAFINVTGNLGTFFSPYLLGKVSDLSASYAPGLTCLAVCAVGSAAAITAHFAHNRGAIRRDSAAVESVPH